MINLNSRDLHIRTLDDGREVVQLKGGTAFDKAFIADCKENGVEPEIKKEDFEE